MKRFIVVAFIFATTAFISAEKIDPRLATVRKAFVVAVDELGDERFVTVCLPERLKALSPIVVVDRREDADAIFKVKADIPSKGGRYFGGGMGKTPSANLEVQLPDGTHLWSDGTKTTKVLGGGVFGASRGNEGIGCALANGLTNTLVDAMREARGKDGSK